MKMGRSRTIAWAVPSPDVDGERPGRSLNAAGLPFPAYNVEKAKCLLTGLLWAENEKMFINGFLNLKPF